MWVVFKYKKKEYNLLVKELKNKLGDLAKFYNPKIVYEKELKKKKKSFEDYVLKGYAFCYYEDFQSKNYITKLKNLKGLEYFLSGYTEHQNQIIEFINTCKKHEDVNGYIQNSFFSNLNFSKIKFLNGPFSNLIFKILEKDKKRFEVILGKMKLTISNKSNYIYSPIY